MSEFLAVVQQFNLLSAFGLTILLAVLGALGSLLLGSIIAIMRVSPVPSLQFFARGYVTIIRNSPLTLILFFCVFALGNALLINPTPWTNDLFTYNLAWGVIAISVYHASFVAEAIRSGINTVPQGQAEAARAIGLGFGPALRLVILPQAFRGAITPLGNVMIALTKNTTVCAAVGLSEAAATMKTMLEFNPNFLFAIFAVVALGFVVLTLPAGILITWASRRFAVQR